MPEKKNETELSTAAREAIADGLKVESEHKDTYAFIAEYVENHGKMPPAENMYRHIANDHVTKEGDRYYIELDEMEKRLKKNPNAGSEKPATGCRVMLTKPRRAATAPGSGHLELPFTLEFSLDIPDEGLLRYFFDNDPAPFLQWAKSFAEVRIDHKFINHYNHTERSLTTRMLGETDNFDVKLGDARLEKGYLVFDGVVAFDYKLSDEFEIEDVLFEATYVVEHAVLHDFDGDAEVTKATQAARKHIAATDGEEKGGSVFEVKMFSETGDEIARYTVDGTRADVQKDATQVMAIIGGSKLDIKPLRKPAKAGSQTETSAEVTDRSKDEPDRGSGAGDMGKETGDIEAKAVFVGATSKPKPDSGHQRAHPIHTSVKEAKKVSDKEGMTQRDKQRTRPLLSSPGTSGPGGGMGGSAAQEQRQPRAKPAAAEAVAVRRDPALERYRFVDITKVPFSVLAACVRETDFWNDIAVAELKRLKVAIPDDVRDKDARASRLFLEEERRGVATWLRENYGNDAEKLLKTRFSFYVDADAVAKALVSTPSK